MMTPRLVWAWPGAEIRRSAREDVRVQRGGRIERRTDPGEQGPVRLSPRQRQPPRLERPDAVLGRDGPPERSDEGEHRVLVAAVRGRRGNDVHVAGPVGGRA